MNKIYLPFLMSIALATTQASADCDESVKTLKTQHAPGLSLCEIQDRFKSAISKLKAKGIENPTQIGNVHAPRFISIDDWRSYLAKNGDSKFAAWKVYDPSPDTWGNWVKGVLFSQQAELTQILLTGTSNDLLDWLLKLHILEVDKILDAEHVGRWRTYVIEYIPVHGVREAYTVDEIDRINHAPYFSSKTGEPLVIYKPVVCKDLPATAQKIDELRFKLNSSDPKEPVKACGDLTMAPQEEVMDQMQKWAAYFLNGYRMLVQNPSQIDILSFVSHAQQWFVLVHPFTDGNGRTSRLMMDVVFTRFGLPSIVLDDMNRDFFASADEWAEAVGKGMLNTVQALESCAQNPARLGCEVISSTPPPKD